MRAVFSAILIGVWVMAVAEHRIKVYHEINDEGYTIYADNDEYCPVSLEMDFIVTNLKATDENTTVFVVPGKSKRLSVTEFVFIKKGRQSGLSYSIRAQYGNHLQTEYDRAFVYYLPFMNGESFTVWQGYNGAFSHRNENSLDFTMPIGTEIYAARGGVVCKVVESNSRHCEERECYKYNNYIRVYHSDGTFAEYAHIRKGGAIVNEGDEVSTGQHIGYSGNVGWSSGPHLHFSVFLQRIDSRHSIQTKFLINSDLDPIFLEEKKAYRREYQ